VAKDIKELIKADSVQPPTSAGAEEKTEHEKKPAGVRRASKEEFEKSHSKITKLHAGLFRRLAK
jgi:ribosomal protein L12E/L44/L45/RPP1/RPP2